MDLVTADLKVKLGDYLERRTVPKGLAGNQRAMQGELENLVRCLRRYADTSDVRAWWDRFEAVISETCETRAWPTAFEIKRAALKIGTAPAKRPIEKGDLDTLKITASRIRASEPVGEGYLWGRLAKQIVARGLVSEGELNAYRRRAEWAIRETYMADVADGMIANLHKRHADAVDTEAAARGLDG